MARSRCLKWGQALAVMCFLILTALSGLSEAIRPQDLYRYLSDNHLTENYMVDAVEEVVDNLVRVAPQWESYRINNAYRPEALNIYIVDSSVFPQENPFLEYHIPLAKAMIENNAVTDERNSIIFIDSGLLKELVTCSIMYAEQSLAIQHAVGSIRLYGVRAFASYWNPTLNPSLSLSQNSQSWMGLFKGAVAFLVGHEMGHIVIGEPDFPNKRSPLPYSRRDRDLHWACPELVNPYFNQWRQLENRVDNYSVDLISRILSSARVGGRRYFRYELGAHFLMLYYINNEFITGMRVTDSPFIQNLMRIRLGDELYVGLRNQSAGGDPLGSVHIFFDKKHPATVERMMKSLGDLAGSPNSLFYGESPGSDEQIFQLLVNRVCAELRQKYGLP